MKTFWDEVYDRLRELEFEQNTRELDQRMDGYRHMLSKMMIPPEQKIYDIPPEREVDHSGCFAFISTSAIDKFSTGINAHQNLSQLVAIDKEEREIVGHVNMMPDSSGED